MMRETRIELGGDVRFIFIYLTKRISVTENRSDHFIEGEEGPLGKLGNSSQDDLGYFESFSNHGLDPITEGQTILFIAGWKHFRILCEIKCTLVRYMAVYLRYR